MKTNVGLDPKKGPIGMRSDPFRTNSIAPDKTPHSSPKSSVRRHRRYAIVCEADPAIAMKKMAALHQADTKALRLSKIGYSLGTIQTGSNKG